jgi:hypothetical protein
MGLIKDYTFSDGHKVLNVLEIGVFNGVSSLYMLKEGVKSRGEQFQLYGIDIMPDEGFLAQAVHSDATDEEKSHYRLCAKSTTFDLEKNLGDTKIDMVFIDGNHNHPYVVIDLINIIPFLHKESLVCLHDSFDYKVYNEWGACYIYDVWEGYKYLAQTMNLKLEPTFPNSLSLIEIPENKEMLYRNLLTVIDIPVKPSLWQMSSENRDLLSDESVLRLENFISRYYDTVLPVIFAADCEIILPNIGGIFTDTSTKTNISTIYLLTKTGKLFS